jgi:selenocysteine-specific elongation factor
MQTSKHVVVGTAGHVDHGKSALVEALTGTNPDRLEEEKRRGITIDLGFAFLDLGHVQFDFVDVPGHERFVRNMLAGAGGIDMVLLAVAADESIKPQTREHFDVCRLLGVSAGLVAITKSDLVDTDALELLRLQIEEFVRASFLDGALIVPVSARTGAGLDTLKESLLRTAAQIPARDATHHLRLPIDRSFAMRGFGTVVTGTLVSGSVGIDDEVELYPARRRLRVRGIHTGGQSILRAFAGQRTAVNLAGIEHTEIHRGMTLGPTGVFEPTRRIDARITVLPSVQLLNNRARLRLHQGTAETTAVVNLLNCDEIVAGDPAMAQLILSDKALFLPGDRFILRQLSPAATVAGGIVIDAHPQRHRRNDPAVISLLETLEHGSPEDILLAYLQSSPSGLVLGEILARTGWMELEILDAAHKLAKLGTLRFVSEAPLHLITEQAMADCSSSLREAVNAFHMANSLLPGIPKRDLCGRVGNLRPDIFEVALTDLVNAEILTVSGDIVQRAGYTIELTPEESRAKSLIEQEFERAGLAVPNFTDMLDKLPVEAVRAQKILQILLREKALIKVADDFISHRSAITRLKKTLSRYRAERGDCLPVAAFKQLTGLTRKRAIPLLEFLDREHVTRRVGDERVILDEQR